MQLARVVFSPPEPPQITADWQNDSDTMSPAFFWVDKPYQLY